MNNSDQAITEDVLAQIEARYEATTPAPWKSIVEARGETVGSDFISTGGEDIYLTGATVADQDFIAHARQDVPRLIAHIRYLTELLNRKL